MKLNRILGAGLLPIVLTGLVAIAPAASARVVQVNESQLNQEVGRRLSTLSWYGVFDNLQYQVNGSEVILSGQVISEHDQTKYDAEKAIKTIEGVTKVVNSIQVLPLSPMDNRIRQAEYRAIFSKSDLSRYTLGVIPPVHIIVNGGHVALEGTVINQMDRIVAGIAANSVPGVFSVKNDLQVTS
jgi:hyperosmotically inducible protein